MFKPMQAATVEDLANGDVVYPVLCSPKVDGIRATVNSVVLSKHNKPLPSVWIQDLYGRPEFAGLDGEMIVGNPVAEDVWNKSNSMCMSRGKTPEENFPGDALIFHVFDYFDPDAGYVARRAHAEQMLKRLPKELRKAATLLPQRLCRNAAEALAYYTELDGLGYEGMMGRKPEGLYKFGRSTLNEGWLWKYKAFIDQEARILEVHEAMLNTNEQKVNELGNKQRSSAKAGKVGKGMVGAFTVAGKDGVPFRVGPGTLKEAERISLWATRKKLIGRSLTYKSQKTTVAGGKARIPQFLKWPE